MRRRLLLAAVLLAALVAAGALRAAAPVGVADTSRLLAGIPQQGITLGRATAPVGVLEVADVQCPYCRAFMLSAFPALVRDLVRPGKVRFVFNGVAFLGPDSRTGLDAVLAAGVQNRLWTLLDLLYRNQGAENSGWLTEPVLRGAAAAVPGLDLRRWQRDRASSGVAGARTGAADLARRLGVPGTPAFLVTRAGHRPVPVLSYHLQPLRAAILQLLR